MGLIGVAAGHFLLPAEPALIAGLPGDWDARNAELDRRVAQRFPNGSSVDTMTVELKRQGFTVTITPEGGRAHWEEAGIPCTDMVDVNWRTEARRAGSIEASAWQTCL